MGADLRALLAKLREYGTPQDTHLLAPGGLRFKEGECVEPESLWIPVDHYGVQVYADGSVWMNHVQLAPNVGEISTDDDDEDATPCG
jgi:hypothetical protein